MRADLVVNNLVRVYGDRGQVLMKSDGAMASGYTEGTSPEPSSPP